MLGADLGQALGGLDRRRNLRHDVKLQLSFDNLGRSQRGVAVSILLLEPTNRLLIPDWEKRIFQKVLIH